MTIAHPRDGSQAATLVQQADTAMYRSKDAGRNRVTIFDSSMRDRVARRVELERRLRRALNERHFAAYFQPIVTLPSGRVHGFEALARWNEDGHMISPAEFIPVAEESGLIVPLGAFMLDEACRQLATWRRTIPGGERLCMSVNLSPRQIRESDVVDTVAETLERYQLPGDALWLEITESVMMEDSLVTAGVMTGLRMLGVRLSVDDFGTGFSSLSYLKRFPVSSVKIDRSFVSGLGDHEMNVVARGRDHRHGIRTRPRGDRRGRRDDRASSTPVQPRLPSGAGLLLQQGRSGQRGTGDPRPSGRGGGCAASGEAAAGARHRRTAPDRRRCQTEWRPAIGSGSSAAYHVWRSTT